MSSPKRERARARRTLLETFVAVMDDDDVTVTMQMDLEEAVEHLPAPQRRDARGLLEQSGLEGGKLRVLDLLKEDPDQY